MTQQKFKIYITMEQVLFYCNVPKIYIYIDCNDGTFGYNCTNNCSSHCLNDSSCNKQTGQCDRGCKPGYTFDNCSKGMY